jgi:hypothetical protein
MLAAPLKMYADTPQKLYAGRTPESVYGYITEIVCWLHPWKCIRIHDRNCMLAVPLKMYTDIHHRNYMLTAPLKMYANVWRYFGWPLFSYSAFTPEDILPTPLKIFCQHHWRHSVDTPEDILLTPLRYFWYTPVEEGLHVSGLLSSRPI